MLVDVRTTALAARLAGGLALAGVATQVVYPLVGGTTRDVATALVVVLLAAASVAHAAGTRGAPVAAAMLLTTAGGGFAIEVVGVRTGVPFGSYAYGAGLGPRWAGVPVLIGLAWTMLAWPAALAARRLVHGAVARVLVGAWALAATDLFLDPQMVHAGYWRWSSSAPHLPGVAAVPLTNYAGWLVVSLVLSVLLQAVVDRADPPDADDRVPLALYLWLCAGWVVALAVFGDLAAAAAWGAVGTGVVAVPLALRMAPSPVRHWARCRV